MKTKLTVLSVISAISLHGCTFSSRPWTLDVGESQVPETITRELCEHVVSRTSGITSAKFLYNASITRNDERYDMRLAFVFREPGSARLELLPIRGAMSLGLAVFSPEGGVAIEPPEQRAYRSLSEKRLIEELLPGFSFTIRELLTTLMGNLPSQACTAQGDYRWTTNGSETFIVEKIDKSGTWELSRSGQVLKFIRRDDLSSASPLYIEFTRTSSDALPTKILVSIPSVSTKISLDLNQGAKNVPISDRALAVTIPEDYEVTDL